MIYGLSLILLGVLSASGLIIQRRPDAKELIEKLARYQGYLGVLGALGGAWVLMRSVFDLRLLAIPVVLWFTNVAIGLVLIGNGFLLGCAHIMMRMRDGATKAGVAEAYEKLLPYQSRLGLVAIALGVWGVASSLVWRS